ncbi:pleckstrin homology domain-containing family A member 8-like isoform X2 [Acanthaster planci]|uniref:Pleckstrin homology domain-containing family A member 8-like isoform X2 n=1 Tax=Acanthaster planci TaxID=133434 RepID=A0A8B8A2M3_ACAPL|nr:pleckstrin homology domain-containing family A member 8-like isoform X2 [Acanthaster planci]
MGTATETKYPSTTTREDNNNHMHTIQGTNRFGRALKGVSALLLLVFIFAYTTRTFSRMSTVQNNEEVQSFKYRMGSLRQTEIHVKADRLTVEQDHEGKLQNNSSASSHSVMHTDIVGNDKEDGIQGTGPENANIRPISVDKSNDNNSSSRGSEKDREVHTLFSTLHPSYDEIELGENSGIPTTQFLEVSRALRPLLDAIGSSVSLVEGDMKGNADKLQRVYNENPSQCQTIQDMLTFDIRMGRAKDNERSVISLMWFKRAYEFIARFMNYVVDGTEPTKAAHTAYEEVLSRYHNFFISYSFRLAMNLLPSREQLFKKFVVDNADLNRPGWEARVTADMKQYFAGMERILAILREFYTEHNLEN